MSKINTGKITGKVRIRIMRPWRGYPVGTVISPPGAMRQILLQAKDHMGNKVAELEEEVVEEVMIEETPETEVRRGPGRPRKGEQK